MGTRVTAQLTPTAETSPAVAEVPARELSGVQWVAMFPGSSKLEDLLPPFQQKVAAFIASITDAGGNVRVAATYRPRERAYLMHYCAKISKREVLAPQVPAMAGVNIEWAHDTEEASRLAALAMAKAYGIVYPPALVSRHTERAAVDMAITGVQGKVIRMASGEEVEIKSPGDLHLAGASFGVYKLVSDPPHWSDDGR